MGSHPINLAIRFLLELIALIVMGIWAWKHCDGWIRFVLVIGIPIIAAAIWDTFAVPDDPSRSGAAPIPVPGIIRHTIELAFFAFATWILYDLGYSRLSWIFGLIAAIHYILSSVIFTRLIIIIAGLLFNIFFRTGKLEEWKSVKF